MGALWRTGCSRASTPSRQGRCPPRAGSADTTVSTVRSCYRASTRLPRDRQRGPDTSPNSIVEIEMCDGAARPEPLFAGLGSSSACFAGLRSPLDRCSFRPWGPCLRTQSVLTRLYDLLRQLGRGADKLLCHLQRRIDDLLARAISAPTSGNAPFTVSRNFRTDSSALFPVSPNDSIKRSALRSLFLWWSWTPPSLRP